MNTILVCQNSSAENLQLGPVFENSDKRSILIGWYTSDSIQDAGVPLRVADLLAQTLTSVARLTFPASFIKTSKSYVWSKLNEDFVLKLSDQNNAKRIWNFVSGTPSEITLLSTQHPKTAAKLFDDPNFPWWMQGQIAFLSALGDKPPMIAKEEVFDILENKLTQFDDLFQNTGVTGIVKPGVDGDLFGFFPRDEKIKDSLLNALENKSQSNGFRFLNANEKEFFDYLAGKM